MFGVFIGINRLNLVKRLLVLFALLIPSLMYVADVYFIDVVWKVFSFHHEPSQFFSDVRTIPESVYYDENRVFNYPEIWVYIFMLMGYLHDPYVLFGFGQYIILLYIYQRVISRISEIKPLLYVSAICFSPPVLLLLERGNNDGMVLVLCLVMTLSNSAFVRGVLVATAAGLKLFPIFSIFGAVGSKRIGFFVGFAVFSPLFIWALMEFDRIDNNTPIGITASFGVKSMAKLSCFFVEKTVFFDLCHQELFIVLYLMLFVLGVVVLLCLKRREIDLFLLDLSLSERNSRVFFVFSGIFLGTLLLTGGWMYRLVFVLPILIVLFLGKGFPKNREKQVVFDVLVLGLFLFLSPMMFKVGLVLPQIFAYLLGMYLASIIVLHVKKQWPFLGFSRLRSFPKRRQHKP